ncbi:MULTISPECIES: DUF3750 domain-containing protein [Dickeya]|uniref:DUF3750 domain-containing protein n=1 Tax=Dickeya fangzhongdai TaxID=1778540 RepID=A0A2K8QPF4_9GAMM|nr:MULTISPECIES: DUF3750 domain-containing protein [Dickeya]ATZ95384.1 DUF3750 domain-containing protein [Dickeya fangzhongdai]AYH49037.1 hypothetical protein B6N31_15875 [Dickeya fangzhongdai]MBO8136249.1 DUF3750 domain-containing protein [Dickeya fangzhongdai]QOH48826.1 DUF3750 domain-containing protein [Dickeya fangzhongdai]QOH53130.1 DUF3750 domain-containing protein [Dickeya fangzhongdai]
MHYLKVVGFVFIGVLILSFGQSLAQATWGTERVSGKNIWASRRDSAGVAPDPAALRDTAIVQVYTAPTYGWRGLVAVHPWIIVKQAGETRYQRYEVIGWGGDDVIRRNYTVPDGFWFGSTPRLLVEHRGASAAEMIPKIEAAIKSYPWPHTYHAWPGPNSNTFMAHIGREVPELKLDLPANAIGKDFRALTHPVGLPPSGRGVQVSLLGVLGLTLGVEEGVEVNILGANLGVDFNPPALRLPFIGRLGYDNTKTHEG